MACGSTHRFVHLSAFFIFLCLHYIIIVSVSVPMKCKIGSTATSHKNVLTSCPSFISPQWMLNIKYILTHAIIKLKIFGANYLRKLLSPNQKQSHSVIGRCFGVFRALRYLLYQSHAHTTSFTQVFHPILQMQKLTSRRVVK